MRKITLENILNLIKRLRTEMGISQADAAKAANI